MSNKNSNTTTVKGGIGFSGLLTIVFIVLKLIGVIEWFWVWVLSPLWIGWLICLGWLLIALIITIIGAIVCGIIEANSK